MILVGFIESSNGRKCDAHPDGCGNSLVLEREDNGVGMELRLRMKVADELACYVVRTNGTDGCRRVRVLTGRPCCLISNMDVNNSP